ncbi:hypothetical protein ACIGW3_13645 [Streptomyces sp. NPDC053499]|uniref:hypothetical protein n=1 Tax=Streptomyces sp. NPDC053499 TaxID=3365707 RepID=UPI0037CFA139
MLTGIHVRDEAALPAGHLPEACGSVLFPVNRHIDGDYRNAFGEAAAKRAVTWHVSLCEPARSARLGWTALLLVGAIATAVPATVVETRRAGRPKAHPPAVAR